MHSRKSYLFVIGGALIMAANATIARANENLPFPGVTPGPPVYSTISPLAEEILRSGDWVGVAFYRDPACVPPSFNLLDGFDIPNSFSCTLTIQGFEISPPQGLAPVQVKGWGLGAVPIYFVSVQEYQSAIADRVLTITELRSLPSLKIGYASFFSLEIRPGFTTPPGLNITAMGVLQDGRRFQFQVVEGGPSSAPKHVKIAFW